MTRQWNYCWQLVYFWWGSFISSIEISTDIPYLIPYIRYDMVLHKSVLPFKLLYRLMIFLYWLRLVNIGEFIAEKGRCWLKEEITSFDWGVHCRMHRNMLMPERERGAGWRSEIWKKEALSEIGIQAEGLMIRRN